ncbi:hypothetical protein SAMN05421858_4019 [Haladaptatus litoreus]|uniref:Halobacterial output domain-containing protein n=1 Tax=Haladaptatus litoreus TaxID=553468 RepID=A0A1N7E4T0_9EURY|nr:HalOD1 output domain-containing protein [Haladaptatus litoreus]SIR83093.1 hypothetical protein SAMN05421858_4019 [Haladaptatus litoreus]
MVIRRRHDWNGGTSLSISVVQTVAEAAETDPLELDPLYQYIQPEALNTIFSPQIGSRGHNLGTISFTYMTYDVTVYADGTIEVTPEE